MVKYISERKGCRTLFSTHYHGLVDLFKNSPYIQLGHMVCCYSNRNYLIIIRACMQSCMVGEEEEESITFLYKFVPGACPKSYGFNAAKLAGLPQEVRGL